MVNHKTKGIGEVFWVNNGVEGISSKYFTLKMLELTFT